MQINPAVPYQSTKKLSLTIVSLLAAMTVTDAINTLLSLGQLYFPYRMELDTGEFLSVWDMAIAFMALLQLPVFILTVVFFLVWLNRSYKNLTPLGAQYLEHSSGWAVGYWFIPFVNLVKPFQVVREVWNQSDPGVDPQLNFLPSAGTPALLGFWWALWLLSNIVANVSMQMDMAAKTDETPASTAVFGIASILSMFAAIAAIMVVNGITRRQIERYEKLGSSYVHSEPPPPPSFA
jgi:hypothetical protein